MKRAIGLLIVLLSTVFSAPLFSHDEVLSDRIVMHTGDTLPRFLDAPTTLVVPSGSQTVNGGTFDYVEVGGTLTMSGDVKATTVTVLAGGTLTLECGATLTLRNAPIDSRDVFQWGNGLINFGRLNAFCPEKTPFVPFEASTQGATSITLASAPTGWQVGDALEFTDSRQMNALSNPPVSPVRETGVTIAAIAGTSVTLSKPLAIAHPAIKRPDGSEVLKPRVANVTRRTVIKSENPVGVRGHIAMVGEQASWDVRGVQFVALGRTRNAPVNNAANGKPGTNQIGRYAFHQHHNGTSTQTRRISSSAFVGPHAGVKWGGVTVHQTHDTEILNNVVVDTLGGGYVTEDGNEVRNTFAGNLALFVDGNGSFSMNARQNIEQNCVGCEGAAFWMAGQGNTFEDNEGWNSSIGWNPMNMRWRAVGIAIPTTKGGSQTIVPSLENMIPVSFKRNVMASNKLVGFEYWQLAPFPAENTIVAHNGVTQVVNAQPDGGVSDIVLVDSSVICSGVTKGITSSSGYNTGVYTIRGEIRGCLPGVTDGIGKVRAEFTDTVFQNPYNFVFNQHQSWPLSLTFTRVKHEDYPGQPRNYLWFVEEPDPSVSLGWADQFGGRIVINDWQGTGKNYRLVSAASERSASMPVATKDNWFYPPPDCGPTMGDAWDTCGMSYAGDSYAASSAVALEGVTNALAAPYPQTLPVPRTILTWPHRNAVIQVPTEFGNVVPLFFTMTGDRALADSEAYFRIDNGQERTAPNRYYGAMRVWYWSNITSAGTHTVSTYRKRNGVPVPGSAMTFTYNVGSITEPPPPPPAESCGPDGFGNGIDDDGDGQIDEGCKAPPPTAPYSLSAPSTVTLGQTYNVVFTSTIGGDTLHNVFLDGVYWGVDAQAGRLVCADNPTPCTLTRPYVASVVGQRTHTVVADGFPPVSITVTIQN